MQDLLKELLWNSDEIHSAADQICQSIPGYQESAQRYEETAAQVQNILGYELSDQLCTRLAECSAYEIRAYYSLGLGLREELIHSLSF